MTKLAVAIVAEWYRTHLNYTIPVILLSDTAIDIDPLSGVTVMTMAEYGSRYEKIKEMLENMVDEARTTELFEEV